MQLYLEILSGQFKGQNRHLKDLEIIKVGRNPDSDLPLEDLGISFDHAEIRARNGAYWVVDRGSTNGTYVNGERAYNSKLREGDILKFGKKGPELRYRTRPPALRKTSAISERAKPSPVSGVIEKPASLDAQARKKESARLASSDSDMNQKIDPNLILTRPAPATSIVTYLLAGLFVLAAIIAIVFFLFWRDTETRLTTTVNTVRSQKKVLEQERNSLVKNLDETTRQLTGTKSRLDSARISISRLEKLRQTDEADRRKAEKQYLDQIEDLRSQLKKLRSAQERRFNSNDVSDRIKFQQIQERYNESVVFVFTHLLGKTADGKTVNLSGTGTGFIVTRQGHLITNKHVVYPWKFSKLAAKIARDNITIIKDSHFVAVWLADQRFWNKKKRIFNLRAGYSTKLGTLAQYAAADDVWVTMKPRSGPRELKVHSPSSNNDIVILKIRANRGFKPVVPFGPNDLPLRSLDPIMVLGFPLGVSILEDEVAKTSKGIGSITKIQNSIWIDGSLHPGNSGGPVFNAAGRVIGVSTRIVGSENLGVCIKIEHALKLLGGTW